MELVLNIKEAIMAKNGLGSDDVNNILIPEMQKYGDVQSYEQFETARMKEKDENSKALLAELEAARANAMPDDDYRQVLELVKKIAENASDVYKKKADALANQIDAENAAKKELMERSYAVLKEFGYNIENK